MDNVEEKTEEFIERFRLEDNRFAAWKPWIDGVISILNISDELIHKLQI
jgi:hypothetical protein